MNSYIDQPASQRNQTLNLRAYQRNIPSQPLQPYLDARPVLTKYSILPVIDYRKPVNTPLVQQPTYSMQQTFNPGNDTAPWSGYASNVNHESELRNQIFALQSCSQSEYIPSSNSSLYKVNWKKDDNIHQPFPDLFKKQQFNPVNPNAHPDKVGFALFNNPTRQQIKELTKRTKKL